MPTYTVRYFAHFRELAGCDAEPIETTAETGSQLYEELCQRHGFKLPEGIVKLAIGGQFVSMAASLPEGAEVMFIPPVAGG